MIPGAAKAYNLIIDFGDFNLTILVFVAFFVCYSPGRVCNSVVVMMMKVVCISKMMMMMGECWLALRSSNLITVITNENIPIFQS